MPDQLQTVIDAREHYDAAHALLVDAMAEAIKAGAPQTEIAPAAGIARMTLRRWLERRTART